MKTTLSELLKQRAIIDSKIRSMRVVRINKQIVLLMKSGSVNKGLLAIYNKLHKQLNLGLPDIYLIEDLINQLEALLDI